MQNRGRRSPGVSTLLAYSINQVKHWAAAICGPVTGSGTGGFFVGIRSLSVQRGEVPAALKELGIVIAELQPANAVESPDAEPGDCGA